MKEEGKESKENWGKKQKLVFIFFIIIFYLIISTISSRKTWAECQDENEVKNTKGSSAHLIRYVFFILKNIFCNYLQLL